MLFLIKLLFFFKKYLNIFFLNFKYINPIKYAGIIPTSDKTEYLPPINFYVQYKIN